MKEELHSKERGQFTVAFRLLPGKVSGDVCILTCLMNTRGISLCCFLVTLRSSVDCEVFYKTKLSLLDLTSKILLDLDLSPTK